MVSRRPALPYTSTFFVSPHFLLISVFLSVLFDSVVYCFISLTDELLIKKDQPLYSTLKL